MADKFELASKQWFDELFRLLREAAKEHPEITFSVCEVFTGVPARLHPDSRGTIAWHGFLHGGHAELTMGEVPPDAVDVKTIAEWEAVLPFGRQKIDLSDPEAFARYQAESNKAAAEGTIQHFGDRSKAPMALVGVHNVLADKTA